MKNILDNLKNRDELRSWFEKNHDKETECWVKLKRGKIRSNSELSYLDALEEALCFGWIDSTCRAGENGMSLQRFSPRKKGSLWTELNKARVDRLLKLGLMHESGLKAYENSQPFIIDSEILETFKLNQKAWENFIKFPELYKKIRIDTIQRYKKNNRKQFDARLKKLIEYSEHGEMFGEWNDNGRLI